LVAESDSLCTFGHVRTPTLPSPTDGTIIPGGAIFQIIDKDGPGDASTVLHAKPARKWRRIGSGSSLGCWSKRGGEGVHRGLETYTHQCTKSQKGVILISKEIGSGCCSYNP